ncbi:MAG: hypothetical protein E7478_03805 [Ruminococcaceae bacterium]|nr:hypothetical protein [Oscillospiraceae bacterium]
MDSFTINMPNSTTAFKARAVLARHHIPSIVERTHTQRTGCSFSLRVMGSREKVCALLSAVGIPCGIS